MKLAYLKALLLALGVAGTVSTRAAEGSGKEDLRKALKDFDEAASWVYDDLDQAFAAAKKAEKPLLIVFR